MKLSSDLKIRLKQLRKINVVKVMWISLVAIVIIATFVVPFLLPILTY